MAPVDVACVGHKVYVADRDNHGVRVVDDTTAERKGNCGWHVRGSQAQVSLTPHPILPHLIYICDKDNHYIRCLNVKDGTVTTIAGTTGQDQLIKTQPLPPFDFHHP